MEGRVTAKAVVGAYAPPARDAGEQANARSVLVANDQPNGGSLVVC